MQWKTWTRATENKKDKSQQIVQHCKLDNGKKINENKINKKKKFESKGERTNQPTKKKMIEQWIYNAVSGRTKEILHSNFFYVCVCVAKIIQEKGIKNLRWIKFSAENHVNSNQLTETV